MGNTFFYRQAKENTDNITWREIFSETFKKHSKEDRDRALFAGTSLNSATEADMLSKWDKPFMWLSALKYGLILVVLVYAAYYGYQIFTGSDAAPAAEALALFVPPLIIPLAVMVFLWELNIPKNISLMDCFKWWVIGGLVSLLLAIFFQVVAFKAFSFAYNDRAYLAPIIEEPTKLIASLLILAFAKKNRKIYGMTGLVIGVCVGAGFSAFESVDYAANALIKGNMSEMIQTQVLRGWTGIGGHMLWCASYSAAVALHMKDSKFRAESFINVDFIATFIYACLMHAIFNGLLKNIQLTYIHNAVVTLQAFFTPLGFDELIIIICIILAGLMLLWILRKCLAQVVSLGRYSHTEYINSRRGAGSKAEAASATLVCTGGVLSGSSWALNAGEAVTVGRNPSCKIRLPDGSRGISRIHCEIAYRSGWEVTDRNSSYGTYVNGSKLAPGGSRPLMPGDVIRLADGQNTFTIK